MKFRKEFSRLTMKEVPLDPGQYACKFIEDPNGKLFDEWKSLHSSDGWNDPVEDGPWSIDLDPRYAEYEKWVRAQKKAGTDEAHINLDYFLDEHPELEEKLNG